MPRRRQPTTELPHPSGRQRCRFPDWWQHTDPDELIRCHADAQLLHTISPAAALDALDRLEAHLMGVTRPGPLAESSRPGQLSFPASPLVRTQLRDY